MLDVARLSGNDIVIGLVEELADEHPEVAAIPFRTITGTSYPVVLRTGRPTADFRKLNAGIPASKSTFEQKMVQCFVLSGRVEVDKAVAEAFPGGESAWEAIETAGTMSAAFASVGAAMYYGQNASFGKANGFPGLIDLVDSTMVVDAGGTTDNTATSCYLARFGTRDLSLVGGNDRLFKLSAFRDETIYDANSNPLPGRVADLMSWIGLQNVSKYNVARIKKLTDDSGKGLTDALIADAIAKFPMGRQPTHIMLNKRARRQLQKSRSVTIFTGAGGKATSSTEKEAPIPTEAFGLPIVCTDSILDIETLAL